MSDHARLAATVADPRSRGCLTAIDDFGSGHSNIDRVWTLSPAFGKPDRSLIQCSIGNRRVLHFLPHPVALVHEIAARVVMEGMETKGQGPIAPASGTDLLSGFLLGQPCPTPTEGEPVGLSAPCARLHAAAAASQDPGQASDIAIGGLKDDIPLGRCLWGPRRSA